MGSGHHIPGKLLVGRTSEKGVKCEAILVGEPSVHFASVQMSKTVPQNNTALPPTTGPESEAVIKYEWTTGALDRFSEIHFDLGLSSSKDKTELEWRQIADGVLLYSRPVQ
jgi:hypothetical protein